MTDREEFLQIFRQHVTRPGSEKLLDWLDHKTDFFSAPASTRFHGACTGGGRHYEQPFGPAGCACTA